MQFSCQLPGNVTNLVPITTNVDMDSYCIFVMFIVRFWLQFSHHLLLLLQTFIRFFKVGLSIFVSHPKHFKRNSVLCSISIVSSSLEGSASPASDITLPLCSGGSDCLNSQRIKNWTFSIARSHHFVQITLSPGFNLSLSSTFKRAGLATPPLLLTVTFTNSIVNTGSSGTVQLMLWFSVVSTVKTRSLGCHKPFWKKNEIKC